MKYNSGRRVLFVQSGKYGYVLRYVPDVESNSIIVLRIWHGREDRLKLSENKPVRLGERGIG